MKLGRWTCCVGVMLLAGCYSPVSEIKETGATPARSTAPLVLSDDDFDQQVLRNPRPVLVDCWAPWCGPCLGMDPIVKEVAAEFQGRAVVAKLNVDDHENIPASYEIDGIPAFLFFKDGKLVKKVVGVCDKSELVDALNSLLES